MRMYVAKILVISLIAFGIPSAFSQDGDTCDTNYLSEQLSSYADDIATASYDEVEEISNQINDLLSTYLEDCSDSTDTSKSAGELFTISVTGNVNVRSCANTTCEIVITTTNGQTFPVIGQDGDWYEIDLGDGQTAFIASWLTTRGPDEVIDIYEGYIDIELACVLQANVARSTSNGIAFAITGSAMRNVTVDIYRPNQTAPEPVWRQFDKTFIDTGEPYIHQVYRSSFWPLATYQLELTKDDTIRRFAFELEQEGETTIFVLCE